MLLLIYVRNSPEMEPNYAFCEWKSAIFFTLLFVCVVCVFSYDSYCHSWQDGNSCELASITYAFNSSVIPLPENEDTPWTQQD